MEDSRIGIRQQNQILGWQMNGQFFLNTDKVKSGQRILGKKTPNSRYVYVVSIYGVMFPPIYFIFIYLSCCFVIKALYVFVLCLHRFKNRFVTSSIDGQVLLVCLQTNNFRLLLRQQADKRQTSVCTVPAIKIASPVIIL